jgi:hypothetical protein
MKYIFTYILCFLSLVTFSQTGLIVNEVSQGNSGVREYVELVVVAPSGTCFVDIRGWVLDDNNGDYSGGPTTGAGIASGYLRFTNDPQWQNVPTGSIILIYNATDKNTSITLPDDITDANNDKVYIIPSNTAALLERCTTRPNTADATYSPCTYTTPIWDPLGLSNDGDVMQTRTPAYAHFHGLSFGDGTCNCIGAGPGVRVDACTPAGCTGGRVYSFTHNIDNDYNLIANFTNAAVPAGETPGTTNNAANTVWRNALICVLPLPTVTLKHTLSDNQVLLQYQKNQDEYVKNITLQHLTTNGYWENLADMNYTNSYVHTLHDKNSHYYRIVCQDKDGNTKLSNTVNVQLEGLSEQDMTIYPNPAPFDIVNITFKQVETGVIQVFNLTGQLIYQANVQNGETGHTIDIYEWNNGVYFVRFISNNGTILTQRLLKGKN